MSEATTHKQKPPSKYFHMFVEISENTNRINVWLAGHDRLRGRRKNTVYSETTST